MSISTHAQALLITVNYKSEYSTLKLLRSLERLDGFSSLDVLVVDNCSGEEALSELRPAIERLPNVRLLVSGTNLGYFGAAKYACDHYQGQGCELPKWVVICNPDVVIDDHNFLRKFYSVDHKNVGVLAPRIRLKDSDVDQNPFLMRRPNRLRWACLRLIFSNYFFAAFWDWLSRTKRAFKGKRNASGYGGGIRGREAIYAGHGSFFIFSKRFFEIGGFLDQDLFLYGEEISVGEICRLLGLPVVFEPELRILHDEHTSTGRVITRSSFERQKKALKHLHVQYFSPGRKGATNVHLAGLQSSE